MSMSKCSAVRRDEAGEYVDAIMSSQPVAHIEANGSPKTRKRHLSLPDSNENSKKKVRNDSGVTSDRVLAQARRSLYGNTPAAKGANQFGYTGETCNPGSPEQDEHNPSITVLLRRISGDLQRLNGRISGLEQTLEDRHQSLSDRIDQLEGRLEKKLSDKVAQIIDKRVNSELKRLQKDVDTRLSDIRSDLQSDVSELSDKFESVCEAMNSREQNTNVSTNIIIRDLPEHTGENTLVKVNSLFRDHLKLRDTSAKSAVRKPGSNSKPGVVVVSLESLEDKHRVLKAKNLLRNSAMRKVFIHQDQSRAERLQHANLRALVDAINNSGADIALRGNRVVRNESANQGRNTRASNFEKGQNKRRGAEESRSSGSREFNRGAPRSLFRGDQSHQGGARGSGRTSTRNARRD